MGEFRVFLLLLKEFSIPLILGVLIYIAYWVGRGYHKMETFNSEMKKFKMKTCLGIQESKKVARKLEDRVLVLETKKTSETRTHTGE